MTLEARKRNLLSDYAGDCARIAEECRGQVPANPWNTYEARIQDLWDNTYEPALARMIQAEVHGRKVKAVVTHDVKVKAPRKIRLGMVQSGLASDLYYAHLVRSMVKAGVKNPWQTLVENDWIV